jgi:hypothetical protein
VKRPRTEVIRARCDKILKDRVRAIAERVSLEESDIVRMAAEDFVYHRNTNAEFIRQRLARYPEISPTNPSFNEGANLPPDPKQLEEYGDEFLQAIDSPPKQAKPKAETKKKRKKNS